MVDDRPQVSILVAEDERIVARVIFDTLKRLGYGVAGVVSTGEEAVRLALETRPDLLLMDIVLHGKMDGVTAVGEIHRHLDVPVVYLTAYSDQGILERAKITEPFGYILKPFEENELRAGLEMALYKHQLAHRLRESESRYRTVSEMTSDFACSFLVGEDGTLKVEWATDAFTRMTGIAVGDVIVAADWDRIIHSADRPLAANLGKDVVAGRPSAGELRMVTSDGRAHWMRIRLRPVWDPARRTVARVLGAAQDITTEKESARKILESAARAQALARTASRLNAQLDLGTVLQAVCEETAKALGVPAVHATLHDDASQVLRYSASLGLPALWAERYEPVIVSRYWSLFKPDSPASTVLDVRAQSGMTNATLLAELDIRTIASAPMLRQGSLVGTLNAMTLGRTRHFTPGELELLAALAAQAASAIENARLYEQVHAGRERLQALSNRLVEVQETERRQIARELHDEIGQSLTGLRLILEMSQRLPAETIRSRLGDAQAQVDQLMEQVQDLSLDLRPTMLDDLGLLPALLWQFKRYTHQTGISVSFQHSGLDHRATPQVETAAYRIVQEALTNVARYAGVKMVSVRVWAEGARLHLQVEDLGKGFDAEALLAAGSASGLTGMRERAILVGGTSTIHSVPGSGTTIIAELPLERVLERRTTPR